jgi:ribose/xylose/arabinose/galactoside ABC-type transport system permease subunit
MRVSVETPIPSAQPVRGPSRRQDRVMGAARDILNAREVGVVSALLLLALVGTFATNGCLTQANFLNIGQQVSLVGIMAVGMTFVIVTGEIDLSVGSVYALGAVICGQLLGHGYGMTVAIAAGLAAGVGAGLINGLVTVYLGLPSFIVTLGMLSAVRGATLLITNGAPISLDTSHAEIASFSRLGQDKLAGLPIQFVFMLAVFAVGIVLLRFTRFGFNVYAVGGSREAARLCGIDVARVRVLCFVLLGLLSALAGIIGLAFLDYVQGVTGQGLELTVITSVIVGGTALFGGSGTMLGTLTGVVLIGALNNILVLAGISSFWQTFVIGVVIIVAVALDTGLRRRAWRVT